MTEEIIIAGFGGQGVTFYGKDPGLFRHHARSGSILVPSYGPEMRGGTANVTVIISDERDQFTGIECLRLGHCTQPAVYG